MRELPYWKNYESKCCKARVVEGQPDTEKFMCSECYNYCSIIPKDEEIESAKRVA